MVKSSGAARASVTSRRNQVDSTPSTSLESSARQVGASFLGFQVEEDLEWNGHSTVGVAGRDNWKWYYSVDTGLFLGGQFVINAGGFRVKLIRSDGFGSPAAPGR